MEPVMEVDRACVRIVYKFINMLGRVLMNSLHKNKLMAGLMIVTILGFLMIAPVKAVEQSQTVSSSQERLDDISEEERKVLQELFLLLQEIEALERKEAGIAQGAAQIKEEIAALERLIIEEDSKFQEKRELLETVLKSYQKKGPGSFLEIVLSADSLTTLIKGINAFRDLARYTGELLEALEMSQIKLDQEKNRLNENLQALEANQGELRLAIERSHELKAAQEAYLASLNEEREFYQGYFEKLQDEWEGLKPFFADIIDIILQMIQHNALPPDAVKTSFSPFGIKGVIDEAAFNNIFSENPMLSVLEFKFLPGKIQMQIPEKNLKLYGNFTIQDGNVLLLEIKEGSFYDMSLEDASLTDLFNGKAITIDLKPLIGGRRLRTIEIKQGYVELQAGLF